MRILFAGTPEIAVPSLRELAGSGHELVGVLTAPDRGSGRGRHRAFSPVKETALQLGVRVIQPDSLRAPARREVAELAPDLLACFAYGKIFGPRFLDLFPWGALNVHPSLLPRHRGPSPIPAAILAGDDETGVSIQQIAIRMDAGDVYAQERIALHGSETTATLSETAATVGARLLVEVINAIASGTAVATPQDEEKASYTGLVKKEDGRINWELPAVSIERMVRAYTPWPRAFTTYAGERLVVLEAALPGDRASASETPHRVTAVPDRVPGRVVRVDTSVGILVETGNGILALRKLQLQSRKPLDWRSFLNGVPEFADAVLGGS